MAGVEALRPELADKHGNLIRKELCIRWPPFAKACGVGLGSFGFTGHLLV